MVRVACIAALLIGSWASAEKAVDLLVGEERWARTVVSPYDDSRKSLRAKTYKVYTELYDFEGEGVLTKGLGGMFPHHRGLFIGWMRTELGASGETVDSWHMRGCYQEHVEWLDAGPNSLSQTIEWRLNDHTTFISETRTVSASATDRGHRIFDFTSALTAVDGSVRLLGDLQHAGMQVRLSNEVSKHQDTTEFVLPDSAERLVDDEIRNAWWAMCSAEVAGQRYWIMHMTPPDHPTGVPVYSIRPYARFGAFFEPVLAKDETATFAFRVLVSKDPLNAENCQALYDAYAESR